MSDYDCVKNSKPGKSEQANYELSSVFILSQRHV